MTDRAAIAPITRVRDGDRQTDQDLVAVEAPLSVLVHPSGDPARTRPLGVLMRTPGDDEELVLGLLHAEGIITAAAHVAAITIEPAGGGAPARVDVELAPGVPIDAVAERAQLATSACGLCGRLELQRLNRSVHAGGQDDPVFASAVVARLPDALRASQSVFAETGGLHAAALFDADGLCLVSREDVGRHNAVDKVVGWALAAGRVPAHRSMLAVSGRVAYEIVQKAVMAGIPLIAAVGAPSSLAVDAARAARVTLAGFVRDGRFNVYSVPERLR